jgi:hypothetical protein
MPSRRDALLLIIAAVILAALAYWGRPQPRAGVAYHEPEDGVQPGDAWTVRIVTTSLPYEAGNWSDALNRDGWTSA